MTDKKKEKDLATAKYVRPEATRVQNLSVGAQCGPGSGDAVDCGIGSAATGTCSGNGANATGACNVFGLSAEPS